MSTVRSVWFLFYRINTSIQLRSSLITINSATKWFLYLKEQQKTYFISSRFLPSIPFELTNWVNLSIIFDLFGELYIQTIGDYHKLCSRLERKTLLPSLRIHFSDQTNTRRRAQGKKCQIKDILSEFFLLPPCAYHESLFLKVMS